MGPVICCVDDSEFTAATMRVAKRLSEALGLPLVLLTIGPPTEAPGVSAAPAGQRRLRDQELREAEELLARLADEAGLGADVERRAEIGVGKVAARIVAICEEEHAELVVLGSRGRAGLKAALLGSVSSEVAANAPCPCVVVPTAAAARPSPA